SGAPSGGASDSSPDALAPSDDTRSTSTSTLPTTATSGATRSSKPSPCMNILITHGEGGASVGSNSNTAESTFISLLLYKLETVEKQVLREVRGRPDLERLDLREIDAERRKLDARGFELEPADILQCAFVNYLMEHRTSQRRAEAGLIQPAGL